MLTACTGFLFFIFGDLLWHLNDYLFGIANDSIKNYFTFAYYLKFDKGLHFSGMNYPCGEHIFYTDNQPLFSYLLRLLHAYLIPLDQHVIGIINGLMFLTLPAAALTLYFILKKCLLPPWFAAIGALLTLLLSPQLYSLANHYALANTLILPLIWLCTIRLFEKPSGWFRAVQFALVLLLAGLVHAYYLPIGALLFAGYFAGALFSGYFRRPGTRLALLKLLVAGALPLVLFKAILFFTDPVADRPQDPVGFLEYKATIPGLLYPAGTVSYHLLSATRTLPTDSNHGYAGLAAFICLALLAGRTGRKSFKNGFRKVKLPVLPQPLQLGWWAAFPLLLFALAIPFRFGLMHWLDLFPVLKQFRFAYRFSWMFYYLAAVLALFLIYQGYRYFRIERKTGLGYLWLTVLLGIWFLDALVPLKPMALTLKTYPLAAEFTGRENAIGNLLQSAGRKPEDFQMILPVPYYAHGSEKTDQFNGPASTTMYQSMRVAYQTGIPLSNASLSRTSLYQTLLHTQLLSSDSLKKELLPLLPNRKPILIVVTDSAEKPEEKRLLQKATFLVKEKQVSFYELPLAVLEKVYRSPATAAATPPARARQVVYETFGKERRAEGLFNQGAFKAETGPAILYFNRLPFAADSLPYVFSIWVNAAPAVGMPVIKLQEYSNLHGVVQEHSVKLRFGTEIYGQWVKATIPFTLISARNRIKITAEGQQIVADELLIRPASQDFYFWSARKKELIRNNYPAY